jgi:hypothetical protein
MIQLTDAQETEMLSMLRALKQVVAEAGDDYVYTKKVTGLSDYPGCVYVFNGEPDCLGGRVLAKLGVSTETLRSWEGKMCESMTKGATAHPLLGFGDNYYLEPLSFFSPTMEILARAQRFQDAGNAWGEVRNWTLQLAAQRYGVVA